MQHIDFLTQFIAIQNPWKILETTTSQAGKRLDILVWFAPSIQKNLFGVSDIQEESEACSPASCPHCGTMLPEYAPNKTICLRHLPLLGFATYMHVPAPNIIHSPDPNCVCMKQWHAPHSKYTKEMAAHITDTLQAIKDYASTAKLLDIAEQELRETFQETLDTRKASSQKDDMSQIHVKSRFRIPDVGHPGWQRLINGDLTIATSSVALQMLLQRVRNKHEISPGIESGISGAKALHDFFYKNKKLLDHELEQLTAGQTWTEVRVAVSRKPAQDKDLPQESEPVWQALVSGNMQLQTHMVGLQMIMQQAYKSVQMDVSDQNKQKTIQTLRHFFIKHKKRLKKEITQLQHYSA
ncbi:hypothetical protein [Desulfogranum japonicum]|uniref:hypothetical protein n=1 Tax=Desulfogranum japonicum TaxID=231447 RepID=UPI0003FF7218|nr:hypothetical protein [Desulfogranum japonicum]